MSAHDLKDILLAFFVAVPATLAAVSSLINGRKIDRNHDQILNGGRAGGGHTPRGLLGAKSKRAESKKKGQKPADDWFRPPNLS